MDAGTLIDRLDETFEVGAYADLDGSPNGLQVGAPDGEIEQVALAVDAAAATIEEAAERGADLLVTHHGIIWGGLDRVTGREYDLVERLAEADLPLYAVHLPLDGHPNLGNAAVLADKLDLTNRAPFGAIGDQFVGQQGRLPEPTAVETFAETLSETLPAADSVQLLQLGSDEVETVAIVTGSGTDWLDDAIAADVDVLVTGEGKQQAYHVAREGDINIVLGGHYATETGGLRALEDRLQEWGLDTTFIDHPTGL